MTIPAEFTHRIRIPLIASPMFITDGVELVIES